MKDKIDYFEMLRGVAIMMVVAIHTFGTADCTLKIMLRQILNCAVPLFFALSGLFLYNKPISTKTEVIYFWKKQIPKVYIPVIIWAIPTFALNIYIHQNFMMELLQLITCSYNVNYFVAVIIQFYLLLPLMKRIKITGLGGVILSFLISIIMVFGVTYCNIIRGMKLPLIIYAGFSLLWIIFFVTGSYMSNKNRNYSVAWLVPIAAGGLVLSLIESNYLLIGYGAGIGIKPSAFLFSVTMCVLLLSSSLEKKYKVLKSIIPRICKVIEYLGSVSFPIYLIHYYFKLYVFHLVPIVEFSWFSRWLTVLTCSVVTIGVVRKILPYKYHHYLGIYD